MFLLAYRSISRGNSNSRNTSRATSSLRKVNRNEVCSSINIYESNKQLQTERCTPINTFIKSRTELMKLRELSEYLLQLSLLIFEIQSYSSSVVASSWILWARHILKWDPIWTEDWGRITRYSLSHLIKCANTILSNFNNLKVGKITWSVYNMLGEQPWEFDGSLIAFTEKATLVKDINTESTRLPEQATVIYETGSPLLKKTLKDRKYTQWERINNHRPKLQPKYSSKTNNSNLNTSVCSVSHSTSYKKPSSRKKSSTAASTLSSIGRPPKHVSIVQKASKSFKHGLDMFIQNTGNIWKQVKQEMAQEDFAFSNAFKQ